MTRGTRPVENMWMGGAKTVEKPLRKNNLVGVARVSRHVHGVFAWRFA